jgi:hypothetical protein
MCLRRQYPNLAITETHPKALLKALNLVGWSDIVKNFGLKGDEPLDEHQRDALLGAVAAREGASQKWRDLSVDRNSQELDPKKLWFGSVSYWWPY